MHANGNFAYINGKIYTCDDENRYAQAMTVQDGVITWVGAQEDLPAGDWTVVDLGGKRVIPGFVDAHMHPVMLADFSKKISSLPPKVHSIEELKQEIRKVRESQGPDKWIEGWGYDEGKLAEGRSPTRWDLDEGCSDAPVSIIRTCGHIRCVNSKALEMAGITKDTPDPQGGQIDRDENGEPTGVLRENARNLVTPLIPETTDEQKVDLVVDLGELLLSQGVTSICDMGNLDPSDNYDIYTKAVEKGFRQKVGIYYMWDFYAGDDSFRFPEARKNRDQQIFTAGLKLIGDGSVSGRTAWMNEPYLGSEDEVGFPVCSDELMESAIQFCNVQHLLLKKSTIHNYREIPFENARLEFLKDTVLSQEKNGSEMLLWIPPSKPYYHTSSVFDRNRDFSKVLVFSSWEMVPRMISIMLSYESERRTIGKLFHNAKLKRGRGYFATKEERRFGITRLKNESEDLICLVSDFLADLYQPEKYLGTDIKLLRKAIKTEVEKQLSILQKKQHLPVSQTAGAQALIQCIKALDHDFDAHPTVIPANAAEVLTDMAIASPAICAYRLLRNMWKEAFKTQIKEAAQGIAKDIFVSLFNKAESSAILDLLYGSKSDDAYYQTVFRYCVDGNFQAMLDEYAHVLAVNGANLKSAMTDAFVDTVSLQIDTQESFPDNEKARPRLRTHFAVG